MNIKSQKLDISIVIPVFNEDENIRKLAFEINESLKHYSHEIIFVDDGSNDNTKLEVLNLTELKQVRLICHESCQGQSVAMRSGIINAKSNLIATLDGDGQNDPTDLPLMIETHKKSESNCVLVAGIRHNRKDSFNKRMASKFARFIRELLFSDSHPDSGCGIRVFDKELFLMMPFFNHMHRFFTILAIRYNANVLGVNVNHRERINGKSKYTNLGRALVGVYDLFGVIWILRRTPNKFEVEEKTKK